jgi:hypothetical protein
LGYTEDRKKVEEVERVEDVEEVATAILPATENRILENNRIQYIIVMDGETREMIEKKFNLLRWELARYNDLNENFVPSAGQMLYLQPKRDKAEPGRETHMVSEGETMYSISQLYGIRKSKLCEMNRMPEGEEPSPGSRLWLRAMKPVN